MRIIEVAQPDEHDPAVAAAVEDMSDDVWEALQTFLAHIISNCAYATMTVDVVINDDVEQKWNIAVTRVDPPIQRPN